MSNGMDSNTKQEFISDVMKMSEAFNGLTNALGGLVPNLLRHGVITENDAESFRNAYNPPTDKQRGKRPARPVDPNAPKRPLPAFLVYSNAEKKAIRLAREQSGEVPLSMPDLNLLVSQRWEQLDDSAKKGLYDEHESKLKSYNDERADYRKRQLLGEVHPRTTTTTDIKDEPAQEGVKEEMLPQDTSVGTTQVAGEDESEGEPEAESNSDDADTAIKGETVNN